MISAKNFKEGMKVTVTFHDEDELPLDGTLRFVNNEWEVDGLYIRGLTHKGLFYADIESVTEVVK